MLARIRSLASSAITTGSSRPGSAECASLIWRTRCGCRDGSVAKARICVRQSYYSVPARYAGRLEVRLGATVITVYDGAAIIARMPGRCTNTVRI